MPERDLASRTSASCCDDGMTERSLVTGGPSAGCCVLWRVGHTPHALAGSPAQSEVRGAGRAG
eukprot:scaffold23727_cov42-Phaeocystis_antarctica.AAC.1